MRGTTCILPDHRETANSCRAIGLNSPSRSEEFLDLAFVDEGFEDALYHELVFLSQGRNLTYQLGEFRVQVGNVQGGRQASEFRDRQFENFGKDPINAPHPRISKAVDALREDPYFGRLVGDLESTGSYTVDFDYHRQYTKKTEAVTGHQKGTTNLFTLLDPDLNKAVDDQVVEWIVAHELIHAWIARTKRGGKCKNHSLGEEVTAEKRGREFFIRRGGTPEMLTKFETDNPKFKDLRNFYDAFGSGASHRELMKKADGHWNTPERVESRGFVMPVWPGDIWSSTLMGY